MELSALIGNLVLVNTKFPIGIFNKFHFIEKYSMVKLYIITVYLDKIISNIINFTS